jgi:hypothetical protein
VSVVVGVRETAVWGSEIWSKYLMRSDLGVGFCHGVGRDINVQCVLIKEMIIIVDHYTLAVHNRR